MYRNPVGKCHGPRNHGSYRIPSKNEDWINVLDGKGRSCDTSCSVATLVSNLQWVGWLSSADLGVVFLIQRGVNIDLVP